MGRGLRERQVSLVTYFWGSKSAGLGQSGNTHVDLPEAPRAPWHGRSREPPSRSRSLGQDAAGCLGSGGGGRAAAPITVRPRDRGPALEKLPPQLLEAGRASEPGSPALPGRGPPSPERASDVPGARAQGPQELVRT